MFTQKQREWITGFLAHATSDGDTGEEDAADADNSSAHAHHYAGAASEEDDENDGDTGGGPAGHHYGGAASEDDGDDELGARPSAHHYAGAAGEDDVDDYDDDDPAPGQPELPAAQPAIAQIRKAKSFPTVDVSAAGPAGLTGHRVSDSYDGEHNQQGWRAKENAKARESTKVRTALYTEQERQDHTLKMKETGSFVMGDDDESDLGGKTLGYAMDPKTGEMVAFEDGGAVVRKDRKGRKKTVLDSKTIKPLSAKMAKDRSHELELRHHSTPLGGDEALDKEGNVRLDKRGKPIMQSRAAASAGFVTFDRDGSMTNISNLSGHYKPAISDLMQAVEFLTKQGAFMENDITDESRQTLEKNDSSLKLYNQVQAKLKKLAELVERAQGAEESLDRTDLPQAQIEKYGKRLEALTERIAAIRQSVEKPIALLRKLGVGPSNRIRQDATAEFLDIKATDMGAGVYDVERKKLDVGAFLKTGGDNVKQAQAKAAMLEELVEATEKRRKVADETAKEGNAPEDFPGPRKLKEALSELKDGNAGARRPRRRGK